MKNKQPSYLQDVSIYSALNTYNEINTGLIIKYYSVLIVAKTAAFYDSLEIRLKKVNLLSLFVKNKHASPGVRKKLKTFKYIKTIKNNRK
jgi:hypothetical protein